LVHLRALGVQFSSCKQQGDLWQRKQQRKAEAGVRAQLAAVLNCSRRTAAQALCLPVVLQVLKNFFALWFWDSKPNLVRRLMRLLLTRQLVESMHPCGETYGQVRSSGVCFATLGKNRWSAILLVAGHSGKAQAAAGGFAHLLVQHCAQ
jgi:hypothetical protein